MHILNEALYCVHIEKISRFLQKCPKAVIISATLRRCRNSLESFPCFPFSDCSLLCRRPSWCSGGVSEIELTLNYWKFAPKYICKLKPRIGKDIIKVRSQKKNDIIWEFFPNVGPPPFGNPLSKKYFSVYFAY